MAHARDADIERSWDPGWDPDAGRAWRTVTTGDGVRFVLPKRSVPRQRAIGLGIGAFGLVPLALALLFTRFLWGPVAAALIRGQTPAGSSLFGLLGLIFPMFALILAVKMARFGLLVAFGHSEVEIGDRRVRGSERWGPLRRRTDVPRDAIERVVVEPGLGAREGRPDDGWGRDLANLAVVRDHNEPEKRKVGLAFAYPKPTIEALAAEVGHRLGLDVVEEDPDREEARVPRSGDAPKGPVRSPRPRSATGTLTETPDGVSIALPAMGYFKGSKGLGTFAIFWMGFMLLFTAVFGGVIFAKGMGVGEWFALVIISVFWLVGLGMFYSALQSGRRRGLIDVVGRDLLISRQSIGRPKAESWHADEIDRVIVGPSGTEINDKPVLELQVWLTDGRKRGFFAERRDDELRWIAGEIAARLSPAADERSEV